MLRRRTAGIGALIVFVVATIAWAANTAMSTKSPASSGMHGASAAAKDRFAYLSTQHTNFCTLAAHTVLGYCDDQRMQGSCCNPMDRDKYRAHPRPSPIRRNPRDPDRSLRHPGRTRQALARLRHEHHVRRPRQDHLRRRDEDD